MTPYTPTPTPTPTRLLSLTKAAKYLGIGKTTLRKLINDRKLTPVHVYRRVLIPIEQLDTLIGSVHAPLHNDVGKKHRVFVPLEQLGSLIRSMKVSQPNEAHPAGHVLVPLGHFEAIVASAEASVEEFKAAQAKAQR
ncbi:helix-turn-helix domain-containing protein [Microvirga arabica]|uniref:helix-turn-helix domain-containing protein n=1 Tax=Microvirga arabica TaxID=1128671 RepID=UPI0019395DD4|nr:helix-turn-helix domain-containing protein [Microvirga arabica]MBM1174373.1 helix-turn-helix domain-containing protein [Microvirga arabica]